MLYMYTYELRYCMYIGCQWKIEASAQYPWGQGDTAKASWSTSTGDWLFNRWPICNGYCCSVLPTPLVCACVNICTMCLSCADEWRNMLNKLEAANAEKSNTQSKLDEIMLQDSSTKVGVYCNTVIYVCVRGCVCVCACLCVGNKLTKVLSWGINCIHFTGLCAWVGNFIVSILKMTQISCCSDVWHVSNLEMGVYVILNKVRHLYSIVTCYHDDSVVMVMHVTMVFLILNSTNQLPW